MDYRRDLFPPLLALACSLGLHGALFGVRPLWWTQPPAEPLDTVVVQFLDEAAPAGPQEAGEAAGAAEMPPPQPAARPAPPARERPRPAPAKPQPQGPAEAATDRPPPPDPAPSPPAPRPPEPTAPDQAPDPAPEPASVPPAAPPDPGPQVVPAPPSLTDLLPRSSDLQRFASRNEVPDPTAVGVREATLSLGNEDLRYRGYLDTVHAAIDRSEKWKEAVLMGGGGGVVVVRMTITALGQLVAAEVTRGSGSHLLDAAALDAVQRANIPPFPSHWQIEKLHLHAQFNYQLVTY